MPTASSIDILQAGREHYRAGRLHEAETFYRQAAESDPESVDARLNLGMVLRELARFPEATDILGQLVVDHADCAAGWVQLACAIEPQGFAWEAHQAIAKAMKQKPNAETLVTASGLLLKLENISAAKSAVRRALAMSPESAAAWIQLGQVLTADDAKAEATAAYQQALAIEPGNAIAGYILASLIPRGAAESAPAPATAPPAYVRSLFDGCAEQFDSSLVVSLKYRVPELLERVYLQWRERNGADQSQPMVMLDAGCGTGLCGLWMARYRGRLIGVDLSRGMIAVAKECEVYDEFVVGDVASELERRTGELDLIVAGDVLVYVGDLAPVFSAASTALRTGGMFLFSVEAGSDADFRLQPTQRYAHSINYLHRLASANHLTVRLKEKAVLRQEKGADVHGYLMLLEKTPSGAPKPI